MDLHALTPDGSATATSTPDGSATATATQTPDGSATTATQTPDGSVTATATQTPTPIGSPTATLPPAGSGTLNGQVLAGKPVTVSLFNADNSPAGSVTANTDGTFSLSAPAGTYTVRATASGFLSAQGSVTLIGGSTTTMPTISLLAGDIDNNNVINQFDAMTIGMSYNSADTCCRGSEQRRCHQRSGSGTAGWQLSRNRSFALGVETHRETGAHEFRAPLSLEYHMKSIYAVLLVIVLSLALVGNVRAQTSESIWLTASTTAYKTGETVIGGTQCQLCHAHSGIYISDTL